MDFLISYLPISKYIDIWLSCVTFVWSQFTVSCFIFLSLFSSPFMIDHWIHCFNWCLFVCLYQWNIFLRYIFTGCKYLKWKNHIDRIILNEMIIGCPHILSSQSLNISISYIHMLYLFDLNLLCIVSYPFLFCRPLR